jgi:protein-tyrosine phosphatase
MKVLEILKRSLRNIFRIVGFDGDKKVSKLMNYTSRGGDVADPWYSGDFEKCYRDIYDGCISLLESLERDL